MQLAQRSLVPRASVADVDDGGDGGGAGRGDAAMADLGPRLVVRAAEQVAERGDRVLRAGQVFLQPAQVRRDQLVTGRDAGRAEDLPDLVDRHVQVAEPADDLRGGDLLDGVPAVSGERVHVGGLEQPDAVIVP